MEKTRHLSVIIVEDNMFFRKTLVNVLEQSLYLHCLGAFESCEDAIRSLKKNDWQPDIMLMDIGLPGMSGIEGIPHMKKLAPDTRIVMLTIHEDHDNIFQAICAGASGYLVKDTPPDEIMELIAQIDRGGAPMNAHIAKKVLDLFQKMVTPTESYNLTRREKEILKLVVDGHSNRNIAEMIYLSPHTVDTHIRHIYSKLEVHSRSSAVAKAIREKLF